MYNKKKFLVIYNGGTIGQVVGVDGVSRPPKDEKEFGRACEEIFSCYPHDFVFATLNTKESSNMGPADWQATVQYIYKHQGDFDAVIMAHGTDTLAHICTAIPLGFYNHEIRGSELVIPIVATGAQKELGARASDADDNLERAIMTADACCEANVADILVAFSDRIMLGTRIIKLSETSLNAFDTPAFPVIGHDISHGVRLHNVNLVKTLNISALRTTRTLYRANKETGHGAPSAHFAISKPSSFQDGVNGLNIVPISVQPTLLASSLKPIIDDPSTGAILLRSLGAGNVPTEEKNNYIDAINYAVREYNLPVIIASSFPGGATGGTKDETGNRAIAAGAIPCNDVSEAALSVMVPWLYANGLAKDLPTLKACLNRNFVGESSSPSISTTELEIPKVPVARNKENNLVKRLERMRASLGYS